MYEIYNMSQLSSPLTTDFTSLKNDTTLIVNEIVEQLLE